VIKKESKSPMNLGNDPVNILFTWNHMPGKKGEKKLSEKGRTPKEPERRGASLRGDSRTLKNKRTAKPLSNPLKKSANGCKKGFRPPGKKEVTWARLYRVIKHCGQIKKSRGQGWEKRGKAFTRGGPRTTLWSEKGNSKGGRTPITNRSRTGFSRRGKEGSYCWKKVFAKKGKVSNQGGNAKKALKFGSSRLHLTWLFSNSKEAPERITQGAT